MKRETKSANGSPQDVKLEPKQISKSAIIKKKILTIVLRLVIPCTWHIIQLLDFDDYLTYFILCKHYMWCCQANWVWTRAHHIFSYLILDVILHSKSQILLTTPLKSDIPFQSYDLLKGQNNRNKSTYFLCLPLSPNQYLRILTHFAWSYHICNTTWLEIRSLLLYNTSCEFTNYYYQLSKQA